MITVKSAFEIIDASVQSLNSKMIPIINALGFTLTEDVNAPIHMPPFNQSAMDGYAINAPNPKQTQFHLIGEIQAGDDASEIKLKIGEAIRIFTGAMVPKMATTVAKQEIIEREGDRIRLTERCESGLNIRKQGEQIVKDQIAAHKGTELSPGVIGYLIGLGITEVSVIRKPRVCIVATGNELIAPGNSLPPGKIYESNTFMLKTAFEEFGFQAEISTVPDDYEATKTSLKNALEDADLLIVSGGISVGDYDFVGKALLELGTQQLFHRIKQKPGKPLFFGKHKNAIVFGLPGNPGAAISCFYIYVLRALQKMIGKVQPFLKNTNATLAQDISKNSSLTHFMKAREEHQQIVVLPAQSSAMLSAYNQANCLLVLEEGRSEWKKDDVVEIYSLI